jgi:hypothetical protein
MKIGEERAEPTARADAAVACYVYGNAKFEHFP